MRSAVSALRDHALGTGLPGTSRALGEERPPAFFAVRHQCLDVAWVGRLLAPAQGEPDEVAQSAPPDVPLTLTNSNSSWR
jgi:hypothetical protein